ncbi:hypothetical protein JCM17960_02440 [Magnetospira thiophila]
MRSVVYFNCGSVGDFPISEDRFTTFVETVASDIKYSDEELHKARTVLGDCMQQEADATVGAVEEAAACFIWNYFNTHPEPEMNIAGDVLIIDLNGDGETVEFAAVDDVELASQD